MQFESFALGFEGLGYQGWDISSNDWTFSYCRLRNLNTLKCTNNEDDKYSDCQMVPFKSSMYAYQLNNDFIATYHLAKVLQFKLNLSHISKCTFSINYNDIKLLRSTKAQCNPNKVHDEDTSIINMNCKDNPSASLYTKLMDSLSIIKVNHNHKYTIWQSMDTDFTGMKRDD